jgi:hypothetical protein
MNATPPLRIDATELEKWEREHRVDPMTPKHYELTLETLKRRPASLDRRDELLISFFAGERALQQARAARDAALAPKAPTPETTDDVRDLAQRVEQLEAKPFEMPHADQMVLATVIGEVVKRGLAPLRARADAASERLVGLEARCALLTGRLDAMQQQLDALVAARESQS